MLSNIEEVDLNLKNDYVKLLKKDEQMPKYSYSIATDSLVAPIKKGDTVGHVSVIDESGNIVDELEVTVNTDIKKSNIIENFIKNLKHLTTGKLKIT